MRAKPTHVHNPRTELQMAHRMLFREMVQLAGALRAGLRVGLRGMAYREGMTEMNAFCRLNWDEGGRPSWERLQVSEGPVAGVGGCEGRLDGDVLRVVFEKRSARGQGGAADGVRLLVYNASRRESLLAGPVERRAGRVGVMLPSGWRAEELHVYAFVQDAAGRCSRSVYVRMAMPGGEAEQEIIDDADTIKQAPWRLRSTLSRSTHKDETTPDDSFGGAAAAGGAGGQGGVQDHLPGGRQPGHDDAALLLPRQRTLRYRHGLQ